MGRKEEHPTQGSGRTPGGRRPNEGTERTACSPPKRPWTDLFFKNPLRKNKMKRYFNLLIEFNGHTQCLKMPRDYGDLQLGRKSAGASALSGLIGCTERSLLGNPNGTA